MKDLCKIELKELYLPFNLISDIKAFENAKFDKLEILNLSNNRISDINALSKVNFKKLKKLNLDFNFRYKSIRKC